MRRNPSLALTLILAAAPSLAAQMPVAGPSPTGSMPLTGASAPISPVVAAPDRGTPASREARAADAFRKMRVPGQTVHKSVRKVRRLTWHKKLEHAQRQARLENKPILWIQALGDLEGYV